MVLQDFFSTLPVNLSQIFILNHHLPIPTAYTGSVPPTLKDNRTIKVSCNPHDYFLSLLLAGKCVDTNLHEPSPLFVPPPYCSHLSSCCSCPWSLPLSFPSVLEGVKSCPGQMLIAVLPCSFQIGVTRRAVEMQSPWPPLRDSDLAGLKLEHWDLHLRKPRVIVSQQTTVLDCSLWAFRPYPINVLFSHLPHVKTQTMQTQLQFLHFISLI